MFSQTQASTTAAASFSNKAPLESTNPEHEGLVYEESVHLTGPARLIYIGKEVQKKESLAEQKLTSTLP